MCRNTFLFCMTLQAGTFVLSIVGATLVMIVAVFNAVARENPVKDTSAESYVCHIWLAVILSLLMLAYVIALMGVFLEWTSAVRLATILVIFGSILWLLCALTGLYGDPGMIKYVCIRSRCPATLWLHTERFGMFVWLDENGNVVIPHEAEPTPLDVMPNDFTARMKEGAVHSTTKPRQRNYFPSSKLEKTITNQMSNVTESHYWETTADNIIPISRKGRPGTLPPWQLTPDLELLVKGRTDETEVPMELPPNRRLRMANESLVSYVTASMCCITSPANTISHKTTELSAYPDSESIHSKASLANILSRSSTELSLSLDTARIRSNTGPANSISTNTTELSASQEHASFRSNTSPANTIPRSGSEMFQRPPSSNSTSQKRRRRENSQSDITKSPRHYNEEHGSPQTAQMDPVKDEGHRRASILCFMYTVFMLYTICIFYMYWKQLHQLDLDDLEVARLCADGKCGRPRNVYFYTSSQRPE